jgi:hypothetical protein
LETRNKEMRHGTENGRQNAGNKEREQRMGDNTLETGNIGR